MTDDSYQVIVTQGDPQCSLCSAFLADHRVFPEIRAEGPTALDAAGQLLRQLGSALDGTPNHWHRGDLEQALADVRAFIGQGGRPEAGPHSPSAGGKTPARDAR